MDQHHENVQNEYNLEFFEVKSERRRSLLTRGGFEYYFEAESRTQEGVEYWRCIKVRNGYCPARIHVIGEWHEINELRFKRGKITNGNHNHAAVPENQSANSVY
ncbi:unnamed protein product [Meloidogyne enterolobii]|uniref:Uncharacterized protein n=1 Tax=Meloidogyne enterolobii TaxID=390850 RepID=A0ACB0Z8A8_MELEN